MKKHAGEVGVMGLTEQQFSEMDTLCWLFNQQPEVNCWTCETLLLLESYNYTIVTTYLPT